MFLLKRLTINIKYKSVFIKLEKYVRVRDFSMPTASMFLGERQNATTRRKNITIVLVV